MLHSAPKIPGAFQNTATLTLSGYRFWKKSITCLRAWASRFLHPIPSRSKMTVAIVIPLVLSISAIALSRQYVRSFTVSSTSVLYMSWFLPTITTVGPPRRSLPFSNSTFSAFKLSVMSSFLTVSVFDLHRMYDCIIFRDLDLLFWKPFRKRWQVNSSSSRISGASAARSTVPCPANSSRARVFLDSLTSHDTSSSSSLDIISVDDEDSLGSSGDTGESDLNREEASSSKHRLGLQQASSSTLAPPHNSISLHPLPLFRRAPILPLSSSTRRTNPLHARTPHHHP
mmetsp:Transcript_75/g.174  ORF Transcript_75/g.174 Transcript_75/m.174 type:complete len:285 (-) Transcript_75:62-916(-)